METESNDTRLSNQISLNSLNKQWLNVLNASDICEYQETTLVILFAKHHLGPPRLKLMYYFPLGLMTYFFPIDHIILFNTESIG